MRDRDILFVLGGARSGTTYVNRLLDQWFDFGMGPEGSFVADVYRRRARYGDLEDPRNLDRLIDDIRRGAMLTIMRERWKPPHRVDVTADRIREATPERSLAGVIYGVFRSVADVQGRSRVGNKWPDYWRHLDTLDALFGARAHYLFVLRDGRDVALSTMQQRWGQKSFYACAKSWRACCDAVARFRGKHPDAHVLTLRYEDLLAEPGASWDALSAFVAAPPDADRRARFVAEMQANPLRDNSSKWRTRMSAEDLRVYEAVAGEALRAGGYDCVSDAPRVSAAERARFECSELARKAYWTARTKLSGEF